MTEHRVRAGCSRRGRRALARGAGRAAWAAALAAAGALPATAQAFDQENVRAIWRDPLFQRQFVASYGVNAEIEPRVTPDDVEILEDVQPLMADDLPKAEALLKKELEPDSSAVLDFTLGNIHFQQDEMDDALRCYERAVAKFPSFRRAWRNLGLIHVQAGRYEEAIRAFTRMIELGGGDGYAYGLLGFAYAAREDYQPAEASFRNALLLQPENTEWRLGLTRCVFKQEKFEDAATLLDALLERYPDNADFWLLQAHTYLGMNRPLAAAENFEIIARLGQASVDNLMTLGDIYAREELVDLAANAYCRAIERDVGQPPERPLRSAEALLARGAVAQTRQVAAHLREACAPRMSDEQRRKLLKLEARLAMADGGGDAATVAVLEEIVTLDPLDGEALMLLGQHWARQGEPDRAMLYFERMASIESFEVRAKILHAEVLVRMSRFADAIPLLRRVLEIQPREDIARYLEGVERASKAQR